MDRDAKRFSVKADGGWYGGLEVLRSGAGYYIGRLFWSPECGGYIEPGSRESGYYASEEEAKADLAGMTFDVRDCMENEATYAAGILPRPVTRAKGHTPGPWSIAHENAGNGYSLRDAKGRNIGHSAAARSRDGQRLEPEDRIEEAEAQANGRMMAASPDLFAALQLVVALNDHPERRCPGYGRNGGGLDAEDAALLDPQAMRQIRDAIRKALTAAPTKENPT